MIRRRERGSIQSSDIELDMTPLIDVVFLLIIFFMVATTFSKVENDPLVALPDAEAARDDLRKPTTIVVNVRQNGAVKIADRLYSVSELPRVFRRLAEVAPDRVVVVRCDGHAAHQYFIRTLEACARAGLLNVRVAAKRIKPSRP